MDVVYASITTPSTCAVVRWCRAVMSHTVFTAASATTRRRGRRLWRRASGCVLAAFMHAGCASSKPALAPGAPVPSPFARLAAADAQVRVGCFDCLVSALQEYADLRSLATVADAASIGAARA